MIRVVRGPKPHFMATDQFRDLQRLNEEFRRGGGCSPRA